MEPASAGQGQAHQAVLLDALARLGQRLQGRAEAARDFARLTGRARAISADARQLRTSRWGFAENAERLATDLASFARDVAAASMRAAQEVEGNAAAVEALATQASRLRALGPDGASSGSQGVCAAEVLGPLQTTLEALQARMCGASGASEDAAMLAARATDLAGCASRLKGGGREVEEVAETINKALVAFGEAATSVAARLSNVPAAHGGAAPQAAFRALEAELAPYRRGGVQASGTPGRPGAAMGWLTPGR